MRTCCRPQGTLLKALWWPKWEGNPNQRGYMYTYGSLSGKAIAPHSSTLAWKIPWMEELGRLQSMGSWRVGHDWVTSLSLFTFMHWRRKWQPIPVFLPGESQGWGSLMGSVYGVAQTRTRLKWLSSINTSIYWLSFRQAWVVQKYYLYRNAIFYLPLWLFPLDYYC